MPGLRLLHARKQQILISELFQGYSPDRAHGSAHDGCHILQQHRPSQPHRPA
jgi:hypothetical protein